MQSLEEKDSMGTGTSGAGRGSCLRSHSPLPGVRSDGPMLYGRRFPQLQPLWINMAGLPDTLPTIVGESPFFSQSRACNRCFRASVLLSACPPNLYFFFLLPFAPLRTPH